MSKKELISNITDFFIKHNFEKNRAEGREKLYCIYSFILSICDQEDILKKLLYGYVNRYDVVSDYIAMIREFLYEPLVIECKNDGKMKEFSIECQLFDNFSYGNFIDDAVENLKSKILYEIYNLKKLIKMMECCNTVYIMDNEEIDKDVWDEEYNKKLKCDDIHLSGFGVNK